MKWRSPVIALTTLVLLYQIFAGAYGVGTMLCVGGANGLELMPAGTNCCALNAKGVINDVMTDSCCASAVVAECEKIDVGDSRTVISHMMVNPNDCLDCIDRELIVQPFTQVSQIYVEAAFFPSVIIATLSWPDFSEQVNPKFMWRAGERPPSLRTLRMWSTVILRC